MREPALTEYDPPRPRLTGDERRKGILRAARSEFARVGYYGASTASIARVAGCSEPMLYKHFAGKLDLFMQSLQDSMDRVRRLYDEYATAGNDIVQQSAQYLERMIHEPEFLELHQLRRIAVTVDKQAVRALLAAIEHETLEQVRMAIGLGQQQGVTDPDLDPDYVAFGWLGMLQAACYRESLEPGAFVDSLPHIVRWLRTLDTIER
ncbi:MAG: TetR family transcriptional regulator [Thermoleophilia bacterium]|nr:TetR family transcriptional regulator [Thermoleophilia bacterium]